MMACAGLQWRAPLLVAPVLLLSSCFSVRPNATFSYVKLDPEEYQALLADSAEHVLIDVRTPGEYRKAHMEGAVNFSYLSLHYGSLVEPLDRGALIFLYCETCHRSPLAARRMKRMGFRRVVDLRGGHRKWRKTIGQ